MAKRQERGGGTRLKLPRTKGPARNALLDQDTLNALIAHGQPSNVANYVPTTQGGSQAGPGTGANTFHPFNTIQDFVSGVRNPPIAGISSPQALQGQQGITPPTAPAGQTAVQRILGQLEKIMSGGGGMPQMQSIPFPTFDPNRYKKEAEQSVSAQYDPIIAGIVGQQGATQKRAATNRAGVGSLYAGAVNDIRAQSAVGQKGYDTAQAQSKQLYTDERNRIAAGYAADAAAQRAEAKRLGTEALGVNEAISKQTGDKQFADQMGSQQMQSSQNALEQQQQGAGQYDRSIATATGQEGINAQQDIMNQLEQYMGQSNQDITNTRAQEAGATSDLAMKLAQMGYDRDAQNAAFQYQQQRDYIGDANNLQKIQQDSLLAQLDAAQKAQSASGQAQPNQWEQIAGFANSIAGPKAPDMIAAIQKAVQERGEIYARGKDDNVPMTPALFSKLIADYPGNQGLDRNQLSMISDLAYRLIYGVG